MSEENKEESKGVKAKGASLWGQIVAAVWVAGWSATEFIKTLINGGHLELEDVAKSGLIIAICFSPVYFSILMDKVKEIKLGGKE